MQETAKRKVAIVNADDFGFSPGITEGILRAHREGIVTSTTVAANMPAAADAMARLVEAPCLGVGVHLNISQGPPLSKEGAALAGAEGVMNRKAVGVILHSLLRPWTLRAIRAEFEAQIRWVLDHGVRPTHLDSHRHCHAFWPIFRCVADLARRYNVRFVRWLDERLPPGDWPPPVGKQGRTAKLLRCFTRGNARVARELRGTAGTWGIAHTGTIDADWLILAARCLPAGVTEIMTHPGLADGLDGSATRLLQSRQVELAALCDPAVKLAFAEQGIELIHYGKIV